MKFKSLIIYGPTTSNEVWKLPGQVSMQSKALTPEATLRELVLSLKSINHVLTLGVYLVLNVPEKSIPSYNSRVNGVANKLLNVPWGVVALISARNIGSYDD